MQLRNLIKIIQKQPSEDVLSKRCSDKMLQVYRRKHIPKWDFNNVA